MKKKVIAGVIIFVLVLIVGILLIKERRENVPKLELVKNFDVMEYSDVSIEELVLKAENAISIEITDVDTRGDYDISADGQEVFLGSCFDAPYEITIEAVGKYGDTVEAEITIAPYQEPSVYE